MRRENAAPTARARSGASPVLDNDDTFEYQLADQRYQPESSGGNLTYPNDRRLRRVFSISMNLRNREVNL